MMEKFKPYAMLLAGLSVLAGVWWYFKPAQPAPVGTYTDAKDAKQVVGLEKQPMQGTIKVLPNPTAKKKLAMPQSVQDDPSKHVVDTAQFPITYQPFTSVTVYDDKTGDVTTSVVNDPLPWLAAERRSYVRLGYGVKSRTGKVGQIAAGTNLVQMKALHAGISAELFTDGVGYAGAHVEYQW